MKILEKIFRFLISPITEGFIFLCILLICSGLADFYFWAINGKIVFGAYMFAHSVVMCYVITLFVCLFKKFSVIQKILKVALLVLGVLNLILDTGIHSIMGYGYTNDMTAIIMGTNMSESKEFVGMYINWHMVFFIITALGIISAIWICRKQIQNLCQKKIVKYSLLGLAIIFSIVIVAKKSKNWEGVFLMKIYSLASYKSPVSLLQYSKTYELIENGQKPEKIIIVIGESQKKSKMGSYGYSLNTTPFLSSKPEGLFQFNNVTASDWGTISAFKTFMAMNNPDSLRGDWYTNPMLLDIVKSRGYRTQWISNQSPSGAHDNIVAKFAEIADTTIWCGNKYAGVGKTDYDEIVLPEFKQLINNSAPSCIIVHLMGSHENFSSRYPENFDVFKSEEYVSFPESQRQTRADYDNSILYNDFIIKSLIDMISDKEAILIYFSDHALDVFDTDPEYAGHARTNNPESIKIAKEIPFLIYASPSYSEKFPDKIKAIENSVEKNLRTDRLIYTVMDIMNCDFQDNPVVDSLSMFR